MSELLIDQRNLAFELYEVLDAEALTKRPRFADHNRETFDAAIGTARTIAEKLFAPHNRKSDENEPKYVNGAAELIPEVKPAVDAFLEAGFLNATRTFEQGGMQMPNLLSQACFAHFQSANAGTSSYAMLTMGAANLIESFGTEEQKQRYLQPMIEGRFFGTMALTEPHAGSSLSDIRTKAEPAADGSYRLKGNKIFISGGDHPLSENIVHMVLAKLPDAPPGVKGISLFIVPKFLVNEDGTLGERNDVTLAGLFHKMGWRGTTSTALNFGDKDNCVGYLVGKPHHGLSYMFQMMNEARIGVALGASVLAYQSYIHALAYARERPQGRLPGSKDPLSNQVRIVQHADVRRMLLQQKVYAEGSLSLCLYASSLFEDSHTAPTEAEREDANELLDLLIPMVKSYPSKYGVIASDLGIQILGGSGYIREYPLEQYYRDNRLNPIHEGTEGIHGLDLMGRKLSQRGGKGYRLFLAAARASIAEAGTSKQCAGMAAALNDAVGILDQVSSDLLQQVAADVDLGLANATAYLDLFGRVVVGWIWLRQALVAERALEAGAEGSEADFYQGKLHAARYFMDWELASLASQARLLSTGNRLTYDMQDAWF
ncbi:MAG TPA: acyl-CoA dehydrogenase [Pseudomonas sp.]|nr:acyl-CoA dehydrogenase [Pseudomonas sp.]